MPRDPQKNGDAWGRDAHHSGTYFPPDLAADLGDDEPKVDDLADLSFGIDSGGARERDAATWPEDMNNESLRVTKGDDPRALSTAEDARRWFDSKISFERRLKELVVEVVERDEVDWFSSQLTKALAQLQAVVDATRDDDSERMNVNDEIALKVEGIKVARARERLGLAAEPEPAPACEGSAVRPHATLIDSEDDEPEPSPFDYAIHRVRTDYENGRRTG